MSGFDVVVVGARPAGASTAMLLARAGVRVALVDRSAYGTDTVSTHALMRGGVLQLSRWGLLDSVVAAGAPPIRTSLFHYADEATVRVSIRPRAGVDALYAPRRKLLDRLLVDAAEQAGVVVLRESTVTGLLSGADGRVAGVRVVSRRGDPFEIGAGVTVGADGFRSVVAASVGAATIRQGASASGVLYRYVADLPADGYEWAYGPASAAGLIPTNGGDTCVFVSTTTERMRGLRREGTARAFGFLLGAAAPGFVDRVAARSSSTMRGWSGLPGYIRRSWGRGWALVGDAGYYKDPITTHGITEALRDAELLADELVAALSGAVPEPVALARYQATRDRLSARLTTATEAVARYDWTTPQVQGLLRAVSSAMSDEVDLLQGRADQGIGVGDVHADS